MIDAGEYELRIWRPVDELREVAYADYWNDEAIESEKEWWILDGDFEPMEQYLQRSGLGRQLDAAIDLGERLRGRGLNGAGADVAAGTLWSVPRLLARGATCIYAVEYSVHRLTKLGPALLSHYGVAAEEIVLCLGSFEELRIGEGELDFVLMSQALHHADDPSRLLAEARRVLRPDGVVLVTGEHVVAERRWLPRRFRNMRDPVLGDHWYRRSDYERLFRDSGFRWERIQRSGESIQAFVLLPAT